MTVESVGYQVKWGGNSAAPIHFSISLQLNEIARGQITLDWNHKDKVGHGDTVELYRNDVLIWKGVVVGKRLDKGARTVELEVRGEEEKLNWTLFNKNGDFRVQYDNVAANTIAADILAVTGYALAECPTTVVSIRFEYAQRWAALQKLAEVLGKDLWLSADGVHIGDKGTTKTVPGFIALEKEEDSDGLINRAYVLGAGDGINQAAGTAEDSASQTTFGLRERAFALREYDSPTTLSTKAAQIVSESKDPIVSVRAVIPFTSDVIGLDVGDTITIDDADLGLSGNYKILRMNITPTKITLDVVNQVKYLSEKLKQMKERLEVIGVYEQGATNLYSVQDSDNADPTHPLELKVYVPPEAVAINRVKLNMVVGAFRAYSRATKGGGAATATSAAGGGTTQTSSASNAGQVYASNSTIRGFRASATLHEVKGYTATGTVKNANWRDTSNYIIYLKDNQGKSEQRTVTLAPGQSATYSWANNFSDFKDVTVTIQSSREDEVAITVTGEGQHTHTVTIPDHAHDVSIPDHAHEIDFAIYEIDTGATVDIEVNGQVVKTGSTGETDLDITQYIQTGWNTIRFTPSDLARIQASVFFQVFVRSK